MAIFGKKRPQRTTITTYPPRTRHHRGSGHTVGGPAGIITIGAETGVAPGLVEYSLVRLVNNQFFSGRNMGVPGGGHNLAVDAIGMPQEDFNTYVIIIPTDPNYHYDEGVYKLTLTCRIPANAPAVIIAFALGTATVTSANATTGVVTADITVNPGGGNGLLTIQGTGAAPTGGVTSIQLIRPGNPSGIVNPDFKVQTQNFNFIRWINSFGAGRTDREWVNRVLPSNPQWLTNYYPGHAQLLARGQGFLGQTGVEVLSAPWEYLIAMSNELGKDLWINIPLNADNTYVDNMAKMILYGSDGVNPYPGPQANTVWAPLASNRRLYIEYDNEVWNGSFVQWSWNVALMLYDVATNPSSKYIGPNGAGPPTPEWSRLAPITPNTTTIAAYTPTITTVTAGGVGGTIPTGTYFVRITAVGTYGETLGSNEVSVAVTLGQNITVNWTVPSWWNTGSASTNPFDHMGIYIGNAGAGSETGQQYTPAASAILGTFIQSTFAVSTTLLPTIDSTAIATITIAGGTGDFTNYRTNLDPTANTFFAMDCAAWNYPSINWAPSTAYALNAYIQNRGIGYLCTVAGTSAASGSGPQQIGMGPIVDGTASWRECWRFNNNCRYCSVLSVTPTQIVAATPITPPYFFGAYPFDPVTAQTNVTISAANLTFGASNIFAAQRRYADRALQISDRWKAIFAVADPTNTLWQTRCRHVLSSQVAYPTGTTDVQLFFLRNNYSARLPLSTIFYGLACAPYWSPVDPNYQIGTLDFQIGAGTNGTVIRGAQLTTPPAPALTAQTGGGGLLQLGTYSFRLAWVTNTAESLVGPAQTVTLTGTQNQVSVSWGAPPAGVVGIRIYGRIAGQESFISQVPGPPTNALFTQGAGTLAAGTYFYRVTAIKADGTETTPSTETSLTIPVNTGVNVNWLPVIGATGYRVYGRTSGAELLMATLGNVLTFLDNGSVVPAGAMPTINTNVDDGTIANPFGLPKTAGVNPQPVTVTQTGTPILTNTDGNITGFACTTGATVTRDANGVVTVSSKTPHGFYWSPNYADKVGLALGDPGIFPPGVKIVTSTPTVDIFTYQEAGPQGGNRVPLQYTQIVNLEEAVAGYNNSDANFPGGGPGFLAQGGGDKIVACTSKNTMEYDEVFGPAGGSTAGVALSFGFTVDTMISWNVVGLQGPAAAGNDPTFLSRAYTEGLQPVCYEMGYDNFYQGQTNNPPGLRPGFTADSGPNKIRMLADPRLAGQVQQYLLNLTSNLFNTGNWFTSGAGAYGPSQYIMNAITNNMLFPNTPRAQGIAAANATVVPPPLGGALAPSEFDARGRNGQQDIPRLSPFRMDLLNAGDYPLGGNLYDYIIRTTSGGRFNIIVSCGSITAGQQVQIMVNGGAFLTAQAVPNIAPDGGRTYGTVGDVTFSNILLKPGINGVRVAITASGGGATWINSVVITNLDGSGVPLRLPWYFNSQVPGNSTGAAAITFSKAAGNYLLTGAQGCWSGDNQSGIPGNLTMSVTSDNISLIPNAAVVIGDLGTVGTKKMWSLTIIAAQCAVGTPTGITGHLAFVMKDTVTGRTRKMTVPVTVNA